VKRYAGARVVQADCSYRFLVCSPGARRNEWADSNLSGSKKDVEVSGFESNTVQYCTQVLYCIYSLTEGVRPCASELNDHRSRAQSVLFNM